MPRLLVGLLMALAALLQAVMLPGLVPVQPTPVLVLVLLWTVARGPREGALWAFGTGLALDLLTLGTLGTHALAMLAVAAVATGARTPRFRLGLLLPMLAALAATPVHDAVMLALGGGLGGLVVGLTRLSPLTGLLNLMLVPLLAPLVDWLAGWLARQEATVGRPQPPPGGRSRRRRGAR